MFSIFILLKNQTYIEYRSTQETNKLFDGVAELDTSKKDGTQSKPWS